MLSFAAIFGYVILGPAYIFCKYINKKLKSFPILSCIFFYCFIGMVYSFKPVTSKWRNSEK